MDERENESDHDAVLVTGVAACPAIERVSALMQTKPGLFTSGITMVFTRSCGVELSMHYREFGQVEEMASLLGVSPVPFEVSLPRGGKKPDGGKLWAKFCNGADCYDGGIEIVWYTTGFTAAKALEPVQSAASDTCISGQGLLPI